MSATCIEVCAPNGVDPDSWLNGSEHQAFRAAYVYASNQSCAIPALSRLSAEEAHGLYEALKRGEQGFEKRKAEEDRHAKEAHSLLALKRPDREAI